MEYERDTEFEDFLVRRIATREFSNREGIHQSDLNYCLNKQVLRKRLGNPIDRASTLLFSLGWATQRWLTGLPDEEPIIIDGITVTLDALYEDSPWELKATFASAEKDPTENVAYIRQIMAQCKVRGKTTARLSRFGIMGNWHWVFPVGNSKEAKLASKKASEHPTLQAWQFRFTQDEIDRNWVWFVERRKLYEDLLAGNELLPRAVALPPAGTYECDYCRFNGKECK